MHIMQNQENEGRMKRRALLVVCTLVVIAGAGRAADLRCDVSDEQTVVRAFVDWQKAYRERDLGGTMAIFAPDVVFEFQGSPDVGFEELRKSYQAEFAKPPQQWVQKIEKVLVSSDLAAVFSTWRLEQPGTKGALQENRSVDVLKRNSDCAWKIERSLNYPVGRTGS
jgi:uncharacterized protein (TIGR02246 family)